MICEFCKKTIIDAPHYDRDSDKHYHTACHTIMETIKNNPRMIMNYIIQLLEQSDTA